MQEGAPEDTAVWAMPAASEVLATLQQMAPAACDQRSRTTALPRMGLMTHTASGVLAFIYGLRLTCHGLLPQNTGFAWQDPYVTKMSTLVVMILLSEVCKCTPVMGPA
jgi:hypothetical protein